MKSILPFMVLIFFPLFAHSTELDVFEGTYRVSGMDPYEDKAYKGSARLIKGENGIYSGEWILDNGEKYTGTGLRSDEEIAFVFTISHPNHKVPATAGLQLYKAHQGKLFGTWVFWNKTLVGNETLERLPAQTLHRK